MAFIRRTRLLALLLCAITATFAMVGCARSPSLQAKSSSPKETPQTGGNPGGEDSGGGETFKSSPELVKATIQKAYEMIVFSNGRTRYNSEGSVAIQYPPFELREVLLDSATDDSDRKLIERLFSLTELGDITKAAGKPAQNGALSALLLESQLQFSLNNTCQSADKTHPDAAVARHRIGAPICFNLGFLSRISPAALPFEIFALFIHELAHLKGFREEDATNVQKITAEAIATELAFAEEFFVGLKADLSSLVKLLEAQLGDLGDTGSVINDSAILREYWYLDKRVGQFRRVQAIASLINPLADRISIEHCGQHLMLISSPVANPEFMYSFGSKAPPITISKVLDYRQHVAYALRSCSEFSKGLSQIRSSRKHGDAESLAPGGIK